MLAYGLGGEAWPGGEVASIEGFDPDRRDWAASGLAEILDNVALSF